MNFSIELKNLLIKLLCKDPKERIGVQDIGEIKKHKFFNSIEKYSFIINLFLLKSLLNKFVFSFE